MRPVLEQRPLCLEQVRQLALPIRQVAREQDHVMCPLNGVNTVDLHKAHMRDQLEQPLRRQFSRGREGEAIQVEEQTACIFVGDVGDSAHPTCILMYFFDIDLWMTAMSKTLYHRIYE